MSPFDALTMLLLFTSKSPPSWGVVSSLTFDMPPPEPPPVSSAACHSLEALTHFNTCPSDGLAFTLDKSFKAALSFAAVTASLAIFAVTTASSAIVSAVSPVTSPVCVALVTLAVLAVTALFPATSVSKSEMVEAACVPV